MEVTPIEAPEKIAEKTADRSILTKLSTKETPLEYSSSGDDKKNEAVKTEPIHVESPKKETAFEGREFLNRDLGWLEFNRRVLQEAVDPRTPTLDRLRFLGIFTGNLDEFFMKRVGGLKLQWVSGVVSSKASDGMTPKELLTEIRVRVQGMLINQVECFNRDIKPQLKSHGVHLLKWEDLTEPEIQKANKFFKDNVFPILTPLAVDPGHPFPFLSNLSTSLGVLVTPKDQDDQLFARVKIPKSLPQWLLINEDTGKDGFRFVGLQDIIIRNLSSLFPNMKILKSMAFRITRNIEVERDEEDADDLLEMMEEELKQRKFARIVRLEHGPSPDPWILKFLINELELNEDDVFEMPSDDLDFTDFKPLCDLRIPALKYEPWLPTVPTAFTDQDASIFGIIRKGDVLVHHPYESFSASVERFINSAAEDPKVMAIKMTLYRTDENSPFVRSLIRAAESGKQVVCLIELKARFDEARNIGWAQKLEDAGVHVVYGIVGLKTHAKTALVVRQEPEGLRCYAHIGTGNYHSVTSKTYSDLGLFTANTEITEDVVELFHYLTGRSLKSNYKKLLVAPVNMREKFLSLIDREIQNKKDGKPAQIIAKMNSLEDQAVCRALYKASQAGVEIQLIVRGFCTLRPRVPGLSENIRVISIVGRFLEHSRICYFRNGAKDHLGGDFYFGSADWMFRNLSSRVEAVTPIEDRSLKEKCWEIFQVTLSDQRQAWDMQADGVYTQRTPMTEAQQIGSQVTFMKIARLRAPPGQILVEEEPSQQEAGVETRRRTSRKSRRKK